MAYTYALTEFHKVNRKLAKIARTRPIELAPKVTHPKIQRLKFRYIMEHPDNIKLNMVMFEQMPAEARTPGDVTRYLYRWIALHPTQELPEKIVKLLLVSEAIERAEFTQKKRIKFSVNKNPELLKRSNDNKSWTSLYFNLPIMITSSLLPCAEVRFPYNKGLRDDPVRVAKVLIH